MGPINTRAYPKRTRRVLLAGAVAVATLASACSSSTSAAPTTPASGISSTSGEVAKATAFIKPYLTAPAKIPLSVPLTSPPPSGKTIVFLQCEVAQCHVIGASVKQAAALVGWTYKVIPFQSTNPSTLATALDQALQYHPVAVGFTSPPYALWSQKVAEYKAAGVPLIPSFTGSVPLGSTIVANPGSAGFAGLNGEILANWFIADSQAKGNVLSVNIPDFPYLGDVSDKFNSTVASDCPGCKVTRLNVGIPDVVSGAITGNVVSALRRNPAIKYVVASDSAFMQAPGGTAGGRARRQGQGGRLLRCRGGRVGSDDRRLLGDHRRERKLRGLPHHRRCAPGGGEAADPVKRGPAPGRPADHAVAGDAE
jgi:ribose transport system substrate-binding protein